jgi:probable HAF family extracellular repeat protein
MRRAPLALSVLALAAAGPARADALFVPLGDLPGGFFVSEAFGVSADGSTVVGVSSSEAGYEAFRWTSADGMVGLGFLPGSSDSYGGAVSADGATVVGGSGEAFRWTSGGGMVGLGFLPGGSNSYASAISADGSTVVGSSEVPVEAFLWTSGGGMVGLGFLPGAADSQGIGISADGSTIVGDSGGEAFRWTSGGGMVGLGFLAGGSRSQALDVSTDGSVIVGVAYHPLGAEAFRWTSSSGMVGLGDLPGGLLAGFANGVSADGSTVVGESSIGFEGEEAAFIWDAANGMRPLDQVLNGLGLDLTGWTLRQALDISADGRAIVGVGTNPDGQPEAWLVVIPEPRTGALLALGFAVLAAGSRVRLEGRRVAGSRVTLDSVPPAA